MKSNIVKNSDTLMECLGKIPDHRDNRGKRHELSFVLACVLTAVLSRRTYLSSIHRFMTNKIEWLKDMFDRPGAAVVSRAQLPNILSGVDWDSLNDVCETVLGVHIECSPDGLVRNINRIHPCNPAVGGTAKLSAAVIIAVGAPKLVPRSSTSLMASITAECRWPKIMGPHDPI